MFRLGRYTFLPLLLSLVAPQTIQAEPSVPVFETSQTRPVAISPDGKRLFVANTPAARLEVFNITPEGLEWSAGVPVGLAPIALAVRNDSEVWVVNHLSDSVSIVDVGGAQPYIRRTLAVCDEPGDIVFAGPGNSRAFISMARRGQNCPIEQNAFTEGIGRALVMVFDAADPGGGLGGEPITTITLFGDTPRALAKSPDGSTVYAAVFLSGNQTTSVHELTVCDGGADAPPCKVGNTMMPGGLPAPNENHAGVAAPEVGLVVRWEPNAGKWLGPAGRDWTPAVRFNLPDKDVFAIDAMADPPREINSWSGVGTVLYNLAVHPGTGDVYVANTEANNAARFEGPGTHASTVRGDMHKTRISLLRGAEVLPRHLNKHIDYDVFPAAAGVEERSLSLPAALAFSPDGSLIYLSATGSDEIGIFRTGELVSDSFVPNAGNHIPIPGGGPTGMAIDGDGGRLYVLSRFANAVVTVDAATHQVLDQDSMESPEPENVIEGRRLLYDARHTASNGEASCGTCHVAGNFDGLAWDLGNPDGDVMPNPNAYRTTKGAKAPDFHPMKGPMLTQSLRGMANAGPMHFRGDRTGVNARMATTADDEMGAFHSFQPAFSDLLGRNEGMIDDSDMEVFAEFALSLNYPPNPNRPLDNQLTGSAARGKELFASDIQFGEIPEHSSCLGCHAVDPAAGFYGTDGITTQGVLEPFKTPHMRNLYERVGMFGMARAPVKMADEKYKNEVLLFSGPQFEHTGDQIRGFGFDHAGAVDTLDRFMHYILFTFPAQKTAPERAKARRDIANYMLQFETNLAPIVGQQVTLSAASDPEEKARAALMLQRANAVYPNAFDASAKECELVVSGWIGGKLQTWTHTSGDSFVSLDNESATTTHGELLAAAGLEDQRVTFTCMPPASNLQAGTGNKAPAKAASATQRTTTPAG